MFVLFFYLYFVFQSAFYERTATIFRRLTAHQKNDGA